MASGTLDAILRSHVSGQFRMLPLLLVAVALPFETVQPALGPLTALKAVLLVAALVWLAGGRGALPTRDELKQLAPTLALLGVGVASALQAGDYRDDSLRFVARLALGAFVMLMALRVGPRRTVLWALVLGGTLSALLGLFEALGAPPMQAFKVAPTTVGGELRISATFQYATIAAQYFEMLTPVALALSVISRTRWQRLVALGCAVLLSADVVLTLTRAGMLTLIVVFLALMTLAWTRRAWRGLLRSTAVVGLSFVALMGATALRDPVFDMRLVSENDADWYGAVYHAPPTLRLAANQATDVSLDVSNAGRITWSRDAPHPFELGYRWLTADGSAVLDVPAGSVGLPRDVAPGDTVHFELPLKAEQLPAGTYRVSWAMAQKDVVQFYERGWPDAVTVVEVGPGAPLNAPPAALPRDDEEAPWVVGRTFLWTSAIQLFLQHPVLGVGPDNFRHLYGALLGLDSWDERVQANNLYLEILVDFGVVGLAAFAWLLWAPIRALVRAHAPSALALGLALVVFLVHGLLDTFLAFLPTALLFWVCLGLLLSQKPQVSGR